jgi:hypothetical protein
MRCGTCSSDGNGSGFERLRFPLHRGGSSKRSTPEQGRDTFFTHTRRKPGGSIWARSSAVRGGLKAICRAPFLLPVTLVSSSPPWRSQGRGWRCAITKPSQKHTSRRDSGEGHPALTAHTTKYASALTLSLSYSRTENFTQQTNSSMDSTHLLAWTEAPLLVNSARV